MNRILALTASLILLALGSIQQAGAQSNLFDGKTITYIVATKPGGGYDTMGRLVARFLEKHLPGSRVIVKNVPGAAHLIGAKMINSADADGLTIGTFNTGLISWQLTATETDGLDLARMSWIGKAASEKRVLVVSAKSGLNSLDDLRKPDHKVKMAASGKGAASYQETRMLTRAFGLNLEIIPGYEGTEAELAMLRGEIEAYVGSESSLKPFIANGNGKIILEIGGQADSPNPQASAHARDDTAKAIIDFIATQAQLSRLTAGPPGIPADQLKALREAYMAALADPELVAEAEKLELPIAPASGDAVAERVRAAFDQPPATLALLKELLQEE
ncbi:Bug family tripartite tricarboxylate transporter substrate binding protein [Taklimakanibacter lacteus]|uniref:Bug family tripartite tricarboxylate transporter substrate binding protein n=1 Tax=Taklimakanibacter lacteus TaxID=2268456 RepID=UPI000E66B8F5